MNPENRYLNNNSQGPLEENPHIHILMSGSLHLVCCSMIAHFLSKCKHKNFIYDYINSTNLINLLDSNFESRESSPKRLAAKSSKPKINKGLIKDVEKSLKSKYLT